MHRQKLFQKNGTTRVKGQANNNKKNQYQISIQIMELLSQLGERMHQMKSGTLSPGCGTVYGVADSFSAHRFGTIL